jgi:beta-lactamase class D
MILHSVSCRLPLVANLKEYFLILFAALAFNTGAAQKVTEMDFKSHFDKFGVDGCFVLYNQKENEFIRYNPGLCDTGYLPASTFKIPNALIALEEGVIKDTTQIIKWDGHKWPVKTWNQDQTLKSAMKYSCVWVFTGFAGKIGIDTYYRYVNLFDYGNKDLTGPTTRFWLTGKFRISANQQIEFLDKFYNYRLPVSRQYIDIVKDIIVFESNEKYKLSAKTGGGMLTEKDYIMWLVGYVESNNNTFFYAMNFISDDFDNTSTARYEITRNILRQLKIIE